MKITQTDLKRLTTNELRILFRMVANEAARNPESSLQRRNAIAALKAIGCEMSRRTRGPEI